MLLKASLIGVLSLHRLCVAQYTIGWVGLKLMRVVIHRRVRLAVGMYKSKKIINASRQVQSCILIYKININICTYICSQELCSVHGVPLHNSFTDM